MAPLEALGIISRRHRGARAAAPAVLQFCFTDAAPAPCAIYDGRFGTASRAEASDRVAEEAAGPLRPVAHPRRGPVRSKPPPPPPRSPIASLSDLENELASLKARPSSADGAGQNSGGGTPTASGTRTCARGPRRRRGRADASAAARRRRPGPRPRQARADERRHRPLLRDGRTAAPADQGSMGPPTDAARRRSRTLRHVTLSGLT